MTIGNNNSIVQMMRGSQANAGIAPQRSQSPVVGNRFDASRTQNVRQSGMTATAQQNPGMIAALSTPMFPDREIAQWRLEQTALTSDAQRFTVNEHSFRVADIAPVSRNLITQLAIDRGALEIMLEYTRHVAENQLSGEEASHFLIEHGVRNLATYSGERGEVDDAAQESNGYNGDNGDLIHDMILSGSNGENGYNGYVSGNNEDNGYITSNNGDNGYVSSDSGDNGYVSSDSGNNGYVSGLRNNEDITPDYDIYRYSYSPPEESFNITQYIALNNQDQRVVNDMRSFFDFPDYNDVFMEEVQDRIETLSADLHHEGSWLTVMWQSIGEQNL